MNKRFLAIIISLSCLFALIPIAAGVADADTTSIIHVAFNKDVSYEDSFEHIRELASIVFPGKTAEECDNNIRFYPGGVVFYQVDDQMVVQIISDISGKSYVEASDDQSIDFPAVIYKGGDLNDNYELEAVDYILAKKIVLGSASANVFQMYLADVNYDRTVDAVDYLLIKKCVLGTTEATIKQPTWRAPFHGKPGSYIPVDDDSSDDSGIVSENSSLIGEDSSSVDESSNNQSNDTSGTTSTKPGENELPIIPIP